MLKNPHKVPVRQWRRWSVVAQRTFNDVFSQMRREQGLYLHPKTKPVPAKQWRTTCWNAAWIAAEAVQESPYLVAVLHLARHLTTYRVIK